MGMVMWSTLDNKARTLMENKALEPIIVHSPLMGFLFDSSKHRLILLLLEVILKQFPVITNAVTVVKPPLILRIAGFLLKNLLCRTTCIVRLGHAFISILKPSLKSIKANHNYTHVRAHTQTHAHRRAHTNVHANTHVS